MVAHQIHALLIVALLVPFVGISVALIALVYGLAWKGSKS